MVRIKSTPRRYTAVPRRQLAASRQRRFARRRKYIDSKCKRAPKMEVLGCANDSVRPTITHRAVPIAIWSLVIAEYACPDDYDSFSVLLDLPRERIIRATRWWRGDGVPTKQEKDISELYLMWESIRAGQRCDPVAMAFERGDWDTRRFLNNYRMRYVGEVLHANLTITELRRIECQSAIVAVSQWIGRDLGNGAHGISHIHNIALHIREPCEDEVTDFTPQTEYPFDRDIEDAVTREWRGRVSAARTRVQGELSDGIAYGRDRHTDAVLQRGVANRHLWLGVGMAEPLAWRFGISPVFRRVLPDDPRHERDTRIDTRAFGNRELVNGATSLPIYTALHNLGSGWLPWDSSGSEYYYYYNVDMESRSFFGIVESRIPNQYDVSIPYGAARHRRVYPLIVRNFDRFIEDGSTPGLEIVYFTLPTGLAGPPSIVELGDGPMYTDQNVQDLMFF